MAVPLDAAGQGERQGFQRSASRAGWTPVDRAERLERRRRLRRVDDRRSIGWYRKDFELPDARASLDWAVRFESVNYRSTVWLNGRRVGANRGAYIPFEFVLSGLKRRGTNRLVVRVDSRRRRTDFPPSGLNADGVPTGGWWNYGGILREVYLRRVDTVDWASVVVRPTLPSPAGGDANVSVRAVLRNATTRARRVARERPLRHAAARARHEGHPGARRRGASRPRSGCATRSSGTRRGRTSTPSRCRPRRRARASPATA